MRIDVINFKLIGSYESYTPQVSKINLGYTHANSTNYELAMKKIMDNQKFTIKIEENVSIGGDKKGTSITIMGAD